MCLDEYGLQFGAGAEFLTNKRDLCNKDLALNRSLLCEAVKTLAAVTPEGLNCLDGNSPCGMMGMLWKKYLGERVRVDINGLFAHSENVINANLKSNGLEARVLHEDPCVLLRKNTYDFIFLNCKTTASHYLDSLFSKATDNTVVAITTSEDPSVYWQSSKLALRNYGGVIVKTSYFRELGIRLVIAEMVRAAARYTKGLRILCSVSFKSQQSFTIIAKVEKGSQAAMQCLSGVRRLLHCSVCEDRRFVPNSEFALEAPSCLLSCDCSKNADARTVNELGPIWSGSIFCPIFIESLLSDTEETPWSLQIKYLLTQLLEEAKCDGNEEEEGSQPQRKKQKLDVENRSVPLQPCFYFNSHKHHPACRHIPKVASIIQILQRGGFRASRTHFDPESVRTNASLREYIRLLEKS